MVSACRSRGTCGVNVSENDDVGRSKLVVRPALAEKDKSQTNANNVNATKGGETVADHCIFIIGFCMYHYICVTEKCNDIMCVVYNPDKLRTTN